MSDELPDILGEDLARSMRSASFSSFSRLGYLLGWVALGATKDDGCEAARAIGAEILACDEMRAIRGALRRAYWQYPVNVRRTIMQRDGLPDICVEWVLS